MVKRIERIMLFGFDFEIQSRQIVDVPWGAAWLTSQYTDEQHEMWGQVVDPEKRREIKYGNNIAVLFTALLHCGKYYDDHENFWKAIAAGFNTNQERVRNMVNLLSDARRAQRHKPSKDTSGTARAADQWIDFLADHRQPQPIAFGDLRSMASDFFAKQNKAWLNAAWVPLSDSRDTQPVSRSSTPRALTRSARQPPQGSSSSRSAPLRRSSPSPSAMINNEPYPHPVVDGRKRAASPLPAARSPKRKTSTMDNRTAQPNLAAGTTDASIQLQLPSPIAPTVTTQSPHQTGKTPQLNTQLSTRPVSNGTELQTRIASLEKQVADTKAKLQSNSASGAMATAPSNQPGEDFFGLKKDMASVVTVVGTMMESMHSFVDSLHRIEDEVSGLNKSNNEMKTAFSQEAATTQPISAVLENIKLLGEQLGQMRQEQHHQRAKADAGSDAEEVRALLKDQGNRIDRLARELASEMADMRRLQLQTLSLARGPPPQSLPQAIAAAERDLQHHTSTISQFYHKLDSNRVGRAATERTAEFLALLDNSLRTAKSLGS